MKNNLTLISNELSYRIYLIRSLMNGGYILYHHMINQ